MRREAAGGAAMRREAAAVVARMRESLDSEQVQREALLRGGRRPSSRPRGDPMVLNSKQLRKYLDSVTSDPEHSHIQTIRIGSKSLVYCPAEYEPGSLTPAEYEEYVLNNSAVAGFWSAADEEEQPAADEEEQPAALAHKPLTPAQAAALAEANRRWTNEKHREVDPPPQLQPKAADEEGQPAADQGHTKRIKRSAADNEQPSTGEVIQTVGEGPGPTPALTGESDCITSPAADNEQPSTGEVIQTVGEGPDPTPALTGESVCITSPVGGCVVAAVAVLLGLPDENVRHLLQTKLREMNQHGSADIGNAESDLYHVTVAMEVLKAQGKQVERVRPKELHRMFQKGAKALLLGRLNFNFQPYKQRTTNSKVRSPSQFLQALPNHTARVPVYCWCSADRVADPRLQEG